jgi:hypothetical protein
MVRDAASRLLTMRRDRTRSPYPEKRRLRRVSKDGRKHCADIEARAQGERIRVHPGNDGAGVATRGTASAHIC